MVVAIPLKLWLLKAVNSLEEQRNKIVFKIVSNFYYRIVCQEFRLKTISYQTKVFSKQNSSQKHLFYVVKSFHHNFILCFPWQSKVIKQERGNSVS